MATLTLPGADIRGYYHQLGIQVPDGPRVEASVRCFADPDAHRREDRDPSCSVNLVSGAWQCHGCGARGGAYDAAIARGQYAPNSDRPADRPRSDRTSRPPPHRGRAAA